LSLLEFLDSLVEIELEVGLFRKLGNDEVVVGIEPLGNVRLVHGSDCEDEPFLHLGSRDINTFRLTSTTHREVDIQRGQSKTDVALGNDVERGRVIKDVIVERELATRKSSTINI